MTRRKHSFMDNITEEEDEAEEQEELASENDASANDEAIDNHGYLNSKHNSKQHFDEIIDNNNCKNTLPKPRDFTEYAIYYIHQLLSYTNKKRLRPSGYWRYVLGVYKNLFLAFYFNWIVIFTSPLSSLAFVFTYPIISTLLFAFEIGLKIFMDYLGGTHVVKRISQDFGNSKYIYQ